MDDILIEAELAVLKDKVTRAANLLNNRRDQLNREIAAANLHQNVESALVLRGKVDEFYNITGLLVAAGLLKEGNKPC